MKKIYYHLVLFVITCVLYTVRICQVGLSLSLSLLMHTMDYLDENIARKAQSIKSKLMVLK